MRVWQILCAAMSRYSSICRSRNAESFRKKRQHELKLSMESSRKRIADLDKLFNRIYEDNVIGKLSDERYARMAAEYESEQKELLEKVKLIDNRQAALMLIKEMCMLAHADDELSDSETLLIGKVGEAMGVSLEKIQQISNWVIDRIIWLERGKLIFEEV